MLIHGIVVVVEHIVAVIGKFLAPVPKVVGHIHMTIVDTRIDERHHDTFTLAAKSPCLVGFHLNDIRGDFA